MVCSCAAVSDSSLPIDQSCSDSCIAQQLANVARFVTPKMRVRNSFTPIRDPIVTTIGRVLVTSTSDPHTVWAAAVAVYRLMLNPQATVSWGFDSLSCFLVSANCRLHEVGKDSQTRSFGSAGVFESIQHHNFENSENTRISRV